MNGMEMMLKSFGIDIEAIKSEMNETIERIIGGIKTLADRVEATRILAEDNKERAIRTEAKLDALLTELRVTVPEHGTQKMIEHKPNGANTDA